ncbi:sulfate ABC transporter permease subunit CysT [bacterium]|nr:sulfate ABC transporter permease subunit CysT [bacterium]
MLRRARTALPGFRLSLGVTIFYLAVLVLIPLGACIIKAASLPFDRFWAAVSSDRAQAAYIFTLVSSFVAAIASTLIGSLIAWVLVRYEFPLKRVFDSIVDIPFALPTAVAGLVYSSLYAENGWLGQFLVPLGIKAAYTRLAVVLVLTFIGFPFVVRAIQPVLEDLDKDMEEAAFMLGANRWQIAFRVLLPSLLPAMMTGFALAFARGLGEYGSVVFVSGNMPFKTEIAPVLIVSRLESFEYAEATAIAVVLLSISMSMLVLINLLERWSSRHVG